MEKVIGQQIPDRDGQRIARDIKKNYFHFQNLTKNGNKVWTIYKAEMTLLFSSVLHIFFCWKIYRIINSFRKIDWAMNSEPQRAVDS